jgi:hypothetical protein
MEVVSLTLLRALKDKNLMLGFKAILATSQRDRPLPALEYNECNRGQKIIIASDNSTPSPLPRYHRLSENLSDCQGHDSAHRSLHQLDHSLLHYLPAISHHVISWILKPLDAPGRHFEKVVDEL